MVSVGIPKDKIPVRVYTKDFIIEGMAFLPKGGRLTDFINVDRRFIPITEAVIRSLSDDKEIRKMEFLVLNRDSIIFLEPKEEPIKTIDESREEDSS